MPDFHVPPAPASGIDHAYGPRVHILSHPWAMALLARLGHPDTTQPEVNHLLVALYDWLFVQAADRVLRRCPMAVPTRMKARHPNAEVRGELIDPTQRVVVVDIARAGMIPAQRVFDALHLVLRPECVRQDHIIASRQADEHGHVTGLRMDATKLGGSVDGATLLVPDPMAATGTSTTAVLRHYLTHAGVPAHIALLHLIVTPEYLRAMTEAFPQAEIFAVRLDRGLSDEAVLATRPGELWAEERGLDDTDYIVPGAGGLGEVINNAWV